MNTTTTTADVALDESKHISFPSQIKYIVWNEACERYSYYGMRSILVIFLTQYLLISKTDATADYHIFAGACYLFPVAGAYISDRFWGKYKTILLLSIVYCLGHGFLAVFEHSKGRLLLGTCPDRDGLWRNQALCFRPCWGPV